MQTVAPRAHIWIGGEPVEAEGGRVFDSLSPDDDSVFCQAAHGTANDMKSAVAAAKSAFETYGRTLAKDRERWLQKAAEIMETRQDRFVDALIDEIGSPVKKAEFEFHKALGMLRAAAGMCRHVTGKTLPGDYPGRFSMSIRRPRGVVACITPFNVPLIKGIRLTAHALATGNTVVLLPSEMAPYVSQLIAEVYRDAGFPAGSFNMVTGFGHEIGDALTGNPDVDFVTFTGSSVVGQHINELCAGNKTPVTLELGGKSPVIVLADADLEKTVPACCHGIFTYQGQVCMGGSRIYVERPVFDDFLERFGKAAQSLGMGDLRSPDTIIGPIISDRQRNRVRDHVKDAVTKGATVVAGGDWQGNRPQPTILTGVTEEMVVARQETFGPVTSVYPIDSYEEGLALANDTEYGLSAALFTRDISKALHFAENISSGMAHVNGSPLHDEPHVPFGGTGESGVGREGTEADLEAMTEMKWVTITV